MKSFMLNSAEHDILNAHKYKKISRNSAFFRPGILFSLLINVKMPRIVGILTFVSRKYFILSSVEPEFYYNLEAWCHF